MARGAGLQSDFCIKQDPEVAPHECAVTLAAGEKLSPCGVPLICLIIFDPSSRRCTAASITASSSKQFQAVCPRLFRTRHARAVGCLAAWQLSWSARAIRWWLSQVKLKDQVAPTCDQIRVSMCRCWLAAIALASCALTIVGACFRTHSCGHATCFSHMPVHALS